MNISNLKRSLEECIRSGNMLEVRSILLRLDSRILPREEFSTFAGFARRAGSAQWALKLLKPVVYSEGSHGFHAAPTADEIASYALALCATGVLSEARKLIEQIEHINSPATLQACAYVCIWNWEYSKAIPLLKQYLKLPGLSEFQIALAQINLASSHEFTGHRLKAQQLTNQLLPVARKARWGLIERDALLLLVQSHIEEKEWQLASYAVREAYELSNRLGVDSLLVDKWKLVSDLCSSAGVSAAAVKSLHATVQALKTKASRAQRWEISRDLDYYLAKIHRDPELMNHLYFGTPFASYRKRLIQDGREFWQPPSHYLWKPLDQPSPLTVDLATGEISKNPSAQIGDLCLQLMRILTSDFYRPFKRGSLFAQLYPKKHFDVTNSSHTIANVILRLRKAVQTDDLPLEIRNSKQLYRLFATAPIQFLLSADYSEGSASRLTLLRSLQEKWPYQVFTLTQAALVLDLPKKRLQALLRQAVEEQNLIQMGHTKSRLYRFKSRRSLGSSSQAA